ncbi:arylamine N-acetyltransferase [Rhizobium sp. RU36D]|uniref:arylamine N-acetyltransferase family protein n=1 Tax=Rhizobium sp. RU36D TaxID=1907415 RepID=UPI0009D8A9A8|nr:arylamine N-acetyltransferase [Rhizobium sp. RU36D]SMD11077.1 N-hydroxyarylamine O-acetyltransferase [Rhizobium sp. RU36D]
MTFNRKDYLARIDLTGAEPAVDAEGLGRLQTAQMRAITFENIDPLLGKVPDLDPDALWQKLIHGGRGGYCFELNGLFALALDDFGFSARPLLARVRMGAPKGGPRSHHAFIVSIGDQDYLSDTGFGGPAPAAPLPIIHDLVQEVAGVDFRIRWDDATGEEILERKTSEGWFSLYGFDRAPVAAPDYEVANFVTARWEKSQFPTTLMMTRLMAEGRISLRNRALRVLGPHGPFEEREIASPDDLAQMLTGPFQLRLSEDQIAAIWAKIEG